MRRRAFACLFGGMILLVLLSIGAWHVFSRCQYIPRSAKDISRQFIDLVQNGDLAQAYRLTNQGMYVGRTFSTFETNIRRQFAANAFPTHRPVEFNGNRSGSQSYGNVLRRWLHGRTIDPDEVSLDYNVGLPFEVRLSSDGHGHWQIIYFQSHAA